MKQRIQKPVKHDPRVDVVTAVVFLLALLVTFAIADAQRPPATQSLAVSMLPTPTLTLTSTSSVITTPDWWQGLAFAQPTLEKLPGAPALSLDGTGSVTGGGANQTISYQTVTCPRNDVRINRITTGTRRGWWSISGTATIANLWYWKGELSADGQHWTTLYSSQQPVKDGTLIEFLTTTVPKGTYQLRLMAVDRSGNYPEPCVVRVTV